MDIATTYDPALTLREARTRYFIDNGFGEQGNYDDRWVKGWVGPIPFAIPNTAGRVRAVSYHDLHHVLTGYATTPEGEAEIGTWEIASGCKTMLAAWVLNLMVMGFGVVMHRKSVWAAFVRGRHSENLYGGHVDDELLGQRVGEQRERLGLDRELPVATVADRVAFAGWSVAGVLALLTALALPLVVLASLVWLVVGALG
jgi:predicted cobalt transporter CbtA